DMPIKSGWPPTSRVRRGSGQGSRCAFTPTLNAPQRRTFDAEPWYVWKGRAMPSAPLKFRATEVTRAVNAVRKAGVGVARVDIMPDGRISILPHGPPGREEPANELDQWKASRARSA